MRQEQVRVRGENVKGVKQKAGKGKARQVIGNRATSRTDGSLEDGGRRESSVAAIKRRGVKGDD